MNSYDDRLAPWIHAVWTALTAAAAFGAVLAWTFYPSYRDDTRVEAAVKELQVTASTDPWAASERLTTLLDEIRQGCSRLCDSGVIKDAYPSLLAKCSFTPISGRLRAKLRAAKRDQRMTERLLVCPKQQTF